MFYLPSYTGWGPGYVVHGASWSKPTQSFRDSGEPGALCLTLLTPGEGCQSPSSQRPSHGLPCSSARRDEGGPFTTWPCLSCPHETLHPAHSGGPGPPGLYASPHPAAQLLEVAFLGGGAQAAHPGSSGLQPHVCRAEPQASLPPLPPRPSPESSSPSQGAQEVAAVAPGI